MYQKPIVQLTVGELELMKKHAEIRERIHADHETSRPLSKNYELIGLIGEKAFSIWSKIPMDLEVKPGGDSKIDFVSPCGLTVDVKSARKAYNLFREVGKPHADILVLAFVEPEKGLVKFLGWEWGVLMARQPARDFGYGIVNHYKNHRELRSMLELKKWIGEDCRPSQ